MQKLTWPAVGLIGVLGAIAVALSTLAHLESDQILAIIAVLGGIGGGAAVAGGMAGRVDQIHEETQAQTPVLAEVARRVNGELDQRIAAAQEEAAEQGAARVIKALRDQGVIR